VLSQLGALDTSADELRADAGVNNSHNSSHGALSGKLDSSSVMDLEFHGEVEKSDGETTFADNILLLFSGDFRSKTLLFMCVWFMLSFGSYGISTWAAVLFTDVGISNVYAATFIYACANLPGNIVSIVYMDMIGRQRILQYGMGLAAVSVTGFAVDTKDAAIVVLCAALFNAFSVAGWNALDCMTAEEFPTQCRTTAMGVIAAAGRLGAVSAQFVNGSLQSNIPLLLFVTCGCMLCGAFTSSLLGRDTTGRALQ
jgi:MFS family permease